MTVPITTAPSALPQRPHILFLDGMRGVAALYVAIFHLACILPRMELAPWAQIMTLPFTEGHLAVDVFIVLSGYLLMLPAARSDNYELRGGPKEFFRRRARRIMPPYYAALLLSLPPELYRLHTHNESLTIGQILSHLFMVQNFSPDWLPAIDGPTWTVAVEFQIYIIFALVLIPLCHGFRSVWPAVCIALVAGMLPILILPEGKDLSWGNPWLLSLFGMGMVGATITQRKENLPWAARANRLPWAILGLFFLIVSLLPIWTHTKDVVQSLPIWLRNSKVETIGFMTRDLVMGLSTVCFILCGVLSAQAGATRDVGAIIVRVFSSRVAIALGAFSYSLYLIHFPALNVLDTIFKRFNSDPMALFIFQFLVVFPCVLGLAYVFYLIFERPFTVSKTASKPVM